MNRQDEMSAQHRMIAQRDRALNALCDLTGEGYHALTLRMDDANSGVSGAYRHSCEATWAENELRKAQEATNATL